MRVLITLLVTFIFLTRTLFAIAQFPKSVFSHIEIVIDSADFKKLASASFIRDSLGLVSYDTMQASPLAIGYYINGLENFINFNPNIGYFATQRGSVYLIFQSLQPGQGKNLENNLRSFTSDSIISYDFKNPSFTLTEIIFRNHYKLQESKSNHIIPMLSSYSSDSYRRWGFGDSSDVDMKTFIGLDTVNNKRLFTKIKSVSISVNKDELNKLESMMKVAGYVKQNKSFVREGQPTIFFTPDNKKKKSKIQKLTLDLNKEIRPINFQFGEVTLRLKGKEAIFSFHE